jgi:ligand-binding sensor domain-containing protein/DNA-binding CsgD family transcriptional regulator
MKKVKGKNLIFLVLVFLLSNQSNLFCQDKSIGIPLVQHFSPEAYQAGILNYKITQDQRGYILVGNNKGVLEYDGTNWRTYEIEGNSRVRSVFIDQTGKLFIGTQNELGYLWPDINGQFEFHSLKNLIPKEFAEFDDIWNIFKIPSGIVFASVEGLYIYDGVHIEFLAFDKLNILSFPFNGHIYNQVMGQGLLVLEGKKWVLSDQGQFFKEKEVRGITNYNEQYNLISTFEHGIYLAGKHQVIPWAKSFKSSFSNHKILVTKRLTDGNYAVGTDTDGLYILNEQGELIHHFTKGAGLQSRTILDVFEDSFGNIWVGQNNGISKIEWNSPFTFINEDIGLSGTGYAMLSTDSSVYLGTNNGLYVIELDQQNFSNRVTKIEGVEGQVYSIQEVSGDIIVGCHIGAYQLIGKKAYEISSGVGWWTFIETNDPNLAIAGGYSGLFLLKNINGLWTIEKYYEGFTESSRVMEFDNNGLLFMSHGYKGVYTFAFTNNYDSISNIKFYDIEDGLPSNFAINVFKVNSELIFSTTDGIYRFDDTSESFKPYDKFNKKIGNHKAVRYLLEDHQGNIVYIGSDSSGILKKTNWGYERDGNQLNKVHPLFNDDLEKISILRNNNVAFASREGFILYDKSYTSQFLNDFHVAIRRVNLSGPDSIIFDGNFVHDGRIMIDQSSKAPVEISTHNNSIQINFSAIEYDEISPKYRFKLTGYEDNWSKWTKITEKEYTNLFEGEYSFDVQAISSLGAISPISSYEFTILPPWYRTPVAKVTYFLSILASSFWLIYYNRKNKKIITKQGEELITQDRQLKEVSEKSDEEISKLKNEKLVADIRHKKNQLASTTMHLIDRNDFINSIQKSLDDMIADSELQKVKPKLKRIVSEIEKNKPGNQDWSQFELLFNEVNDNFTKKIKANYPKLTPLETRLCIYLRMSLSTKEIANLSHVTARAVEMSRYRLRKKLNIGKEENLSDFLMKI